MSEYAIKVADLSKRYRIGKREKSHETLGGAIAALLMNPLERFHRLRGLSNFSYDENDDDIIWALKNVSFEVKRGDVVGIIGRNGAGKSTLLKIMSRITEPTSGEIFLNGRLSSLLEVGTGFHPDLTGRENIYLSGTILGMTKFEIKSKFDEIVAFSEIEKFLDTPVKRYSSGMRVRLAFAVAAHLESEILLVDEVLAVGDSTFQKKCINKMESVNQDGRTVLIVSHNMAIIKALCNKAILLSEGKSLEFGSPNQVISAYLFDSAKDIGRKGEIQWSKRQNAPGGTELKLYSIKLLDTRNKINSFFDPEKPIRIVIEYQIYETIKDMRLVLHVINSDGIVVFASTDHKYRTDKSRPGAYRTICTIPPYLFNSGKYFVALHAGCPGIKKLLIGKEFLEFHVDRSQNHGSLYPENWPGIVAPKLDWITETVTSISKG